MSIECCGYKPLTWVWGSHSSWLRPSRVGRVHPQNEQGRQPNKKKFALTVIIALKVNIKTTKKVMLVCLLMPQNIKKLVKLRVNYLK